jgi:hypothetical protein
MKSEDVLKNKDKEGPHQLHLPSLWPLQFVLSILPCVAFISNVVQCKIKIIMRDYLLQTCLVH